MNENQLSTEQLLQIYRHTKGLMALLEAILIERGAINSLSRYGAQTAYSIQNTVKVSA